MGYTTNFDGMFKFSRQLTLNEKVELEAIADKDWRDEPTRPCEYSYYCQWKPDKYGMYLEWDGGEKFSGYIKWLKWLIMFFFEPKDIKLNGEVEWEGEDNKDIGKIIVKDNTVEIKKGKIIYEKSYE